MQSRIEAARELYQAAQQDGLYRTLCKTVLATALGPEGSPPAHDLHFLRYKSFCPDKPDGPILEREGLTSGEATLIDPFSPQARNQLKRFLDGSLFQNDKLRGFLFQVAGNRHSREKAWRGHVFAFVPGKKQGLLIDSECPKISQPLFQDQLVPLLQFHTHKGLFSRTWVYPILPSSEVSSPWRANVLADEISQAYSSGAPSDQFRPELRFASLAIFTDLTSQGIKPIEQATKQESQLGELPARLGLWQSKKTWAGSLSSSEFTNYLQEPQQAVSRFHQQDFPSHYKPRGVLVNFRDRQANLDFVSVVIAPSEMSLRSQQILQRQGHCFVMAPIGNPLGVYSVEEIRQFTQGLPDCFKTSLRVVATRENTYPL